MNNMIVVSHNELFTHLHLSYLGSFPQRHTPFGTLLYWLWRVHFTQNDECFGCNQNHPSPIDSWQCVEKLGIYYGFNSTEEPLTKLLKMQSIINKIKIGLSSNVCHGGAVHGPIQTPLVVMCQWGAREYIHPFHIDGMFKVSKHKILHIHTRKTK